MNDPKDPQRSIPADVLQKLTEPLEPFIGRLADMIVQRWSRANRPPIEPEGKLLTVEEAAAILGGDIDKQIKWLYRHNKQLPFTRRLSRKKIRFDERGLRRWLASRR